MISTAQERRKAPRTSAVLNAVYAKSSAQSLQGTLSKDIGPGGVCVLLNEEMPRGSPIAITITLSEPTIRVIRLEGTVAWQNACNGLPGNTLLKYLTGVHFPNLGKIQQAYLNQFIAHNSKQHASVNSSTSLLELQGRISSWTNSFPIQMTLLKSPPVKISAVASYLPDQVVDNEEIIRSGLPSSDPVIRRALGAVERRAAGPSQNNSEMLAKVAEQILKKAGLKPYQLDRIICSSDPQDAAAPNVGATVQHRIGANCPSYDVQMSCAGWLCGVDNASRCIATGEKRILVLASSLTGSRLFFHNRMHRAIFGDGAGGVLLEHSEKGDILSVGLCTDGRYHDKIYVPYPWSKVPSSIPKEYENSFFMSPSQEDFFSSMEFYFPPFFNRLLEEAGVTKDQIDCFLLHQPSMPLFEYSLKTLRIPREKVINYFAKYGNLVSAEMPVYLDEAAREGRIKRGDTVFALAYGAGFTMGGMVLRY